MRGNPKFIAPIIPSIPMFNSFFRTNWLATLKLNLKLLPWHQARRLPIVVEGPLHIEIGEEARVILRDDATKGTITLGSRHETYKAEAGKAQFSIFGTWEVRGRIRIGLDSCLYIHRGATLTTGKDIYVARDSQIECAERVSIGDNVLAGEIYICDSAGHSVAHGEEVQPMTKPIVIGDGCYFGFRTKVLRGAVVPPHSVIGSGAVCTRDYGADHPDGHLLLTGVPAEVKASDVTPDCHV